ncbi:type II secretion system F family protein [Granulicella tundricola]|uniref:Type II secretion system F domain protein n=1 Tax=Granulicella tundricola (strain ATCC BAA-1859 / DSM 23138 / MP5ACTX9) TaxID=1198114 RepID=E8WY01_GRATM|nr:type II secretion system F family protein [Granulicella tundricola]ADW67540.1 Type II secretion system F domain protein [Granulicella tundricola MP5ACTX9]
MTLIFFVSILVLMFSAMGLAGSFLLLRNSRGITERVLQVTQGGTGAIQPKHAVREELKKKVFEAVHVVRARLGMNENAKLSERFQGAGFRTASARDIYFAARLIGPAAAIVFGIIMPQNKVFWMMMVGGILYLAPDIILSRMVKGRREKIRLSIPDMIDLLVICVDAGLGMDQAMLRVGQELGTTHPQIYEEIMQINREQRAGKLRLESWQAMAQRTQLPEIDGFVNMLMQNERFGTPIARALSTFGDNIRQKRRQRAEELAAKTTVKIIFPLVLFIFPSMFIVLLGPAGISIARGLASGAM